MKNIYLSFLMIALLGFFSCNEDVLDVVNENEPDFEKVYASGGDVKTVASGLYNTFYRSSNAYWGHGMMMATAADNASCSWGNSGMRDMSSEPRLAWNNTPGYGNGSRTKYTFDRMYSVINTSSLVLKAMNNGIQIGKNGIDNDQVEAFARFNMGVAYGTLALVFDKAFIVDEVTSISDATVEDAVGFEEISTQAIKYLDEAIRICSGTSFSIPSSWMGTSGDVSSTELKQYASSWAARIMANTPRNSTQLAAVNWGAVESYVNGGLTNDFTIIMDGWNDWYQEYGDYLTFPGWGVVDMYVINKMDPTMPDHWDDDPNFPHPPASTNPEADKRIQTDFEFLPSNWLRAARGYYHWSNYRYSRRDGEYANGAGPMPEFMLSESELYKAEAMAYTGRLSDAAAIINAGTRTTRGELPDVGADLDEILEAIHHERVVEMFITMPGLQFYEMRKRNLLQAGTPLHFPLPAKTLETFGVPQPFYTFGGPDGQDGINGSNAGWR